MDFKERDLDRWLAPVAVEFQLQRINPAAIDHHEIGRSAVTDIAATAFHLHKHIVPGRLPQRVDRIMRHENRKGTKSLPVKQSYGIFPQMSDEPTRLPDGITPVPRERARVLRHMCERTGCAKRGGFGFARPRQDPHWFCFEHRDDGERYL
ncbi:hypothetical protein LB557_05670 [Mesorhizobium sp. BR115XR7A]|uniref:hypothetical protein n=1 Tax=Mesorhizobium sp. BR115XR7A TaxID=2876645 RepID=UPI001CD1268C|nr:hypothetical protein [Mesorhizobium sp. BR115XR7A]MBZ9905490.1 hypothetical protein [Mesorhizobium sp. BR115XR7A]